MIEIDNKRMWESILSFKCEVKIEDVENNPAGIAVKCIGDSIKHALKEQGLKYENGEIVCIETEPECHCTGIGSKKAEGKLREMLDNIDEESLEETRGR